MSVLLQSRKFRVERWAVGGSAEAPVEQDIIVHPGAAVVLPLLDADGGGDGVDPRIVMIRNYRPAVSAELWELPAGTLEPDDDPAVCAARELEEETGYRPATIEPLTRFYTSPGILTERMYAFLARDLTRREQRLEPSERIRVEIVRLSSAYRMIGEGAIVDGKTIATLLIYRLGLGGGG